MIFDRKKYLDELQAKCLIQLPSTIPFTKNYDIMHLYLRNHVLYTTNLFTNIYETIYLNECKILIINKLTYL